MSTILDLGERRQTEYFNSKIISNDTNFVNEIEKSYESCLKDFQGEKLNLSCKQILFLEKDSFKNLPSLTEIDFSYNQIVSLEKDLFQYFVCGLKFPCDVKIQRPIQIVE